MRKLLLILGLATLALTGCQESALGDVIGRGNTAGAELPSVAFESAEVKEAFEEASKPATLVVKRTGEMSGDVKVSYTVSGTATDGKDYTSFPRVVTVKDKQTTVEIKVTPIDDKEYDPDETVVVQIVASPEGSYKIGSPPKTEVVIKDNDEKPTATASPTASPASSPTPTTGVTGPGVTVTPGAGQQGGATSATGTGITSSGYTTAPAPQSQAAAVACLPLSEYVKARNDAMTAYPTNLHGRITHLITAMNAVYEANPAIGYRGGPGKDDVIDNPGPAGIAVVWTDTGSGEAAFLPQVRVAAAGDIGKNFIPDQGFIAQGTPLGGWGFRLLFTSVRMRTGYTAVRLCDSLPIGGLK